MTKNIDIPNGWEKTEFGNIVILRNKKYTPKSSENLKCIELECIEKENGNLLYYLNSNTQKSTKTYFYKNDILYGKLRPYLKKFIYAKDDGVCSSEIWVFSATKKINNYFLFLIVQTNKFNYITNISTGTRMPRADWDIVSNYPILLPPLAEQEKIAEILTLWDKAIEQTKELIAYKEKQKKGLMQNLLTGKKRLSGFTDEWKTIKLGEVCEYQNGDSNEENIINNGNYLLITLNSIDINGRLKKEHKRINQGKPILYKNDIVMILSDIAHGFLLGLSAVIDENNKYILNQRVGLLRPKKQINSLFLSYLINLNQLYFKKHGQGSSQLNLSKGDIINFQLYIPLNIEEQNFIVKTISKADEEIELLNKQLDLYTEQKKGLMQNLLTGKVRVTV